jgi:hypothetical protein
MRALTCFSPRAGDRYRTACGSKRDKEASVDDAIATIPLFMVASLTRLLPQAVLYRAACHLLPSLIPYSSSW